MSNSVYDTRDVQYAVAIFLVSLALRLFCLDCKGLWYDEVASLEVAGRGLPDFLTDRFGWMSVQTPLHYLVVWLTSLPFDPAQSAIWVRLPSALAGAFAAVVVFGLGRELFGRAQGVLAALALAFSAVHVGYSQDLRPYSLLALFTALSVYCLLVAERTGERRWWVGFTVVSLVNLFLSYFALTLVLPALLPYLGWRIYRGRASKSGRFALISLLAIVLGSAPIVLDLAAVPRNSPDLSLLTPSLVATQYTVALTQLTRIGVGGGVELALQWLFFLAALAGLGFAIRDKRWSGVILCASFVIIPSLLMALFRTSNTVFQRYILFSLPFYLLLVANGVVALWGLITPRIGNPNRARVGGIALATLLLVPFAYSAWVYFDPGQYRVFNSQPDYRGVAQYLRSVAQPGDLIVVADEPALGSTVLDYYWRGEPPAALFDARDPRLPIKTGGNVYYVVSFFQNDPAFLDKLSIADSGWYDAHFARVAVLGAPPGDVSASLDRLVSLLEAENAQFQPVQTLRASLDQLEGAVAEAADGYASAGAYFGTGEEYLRTAEGYLQRGDRARAWREALISKFMRPGSPALHEWLAARLIEESRPALGVIEREVARLVDKKE